VALSFLALVVYGASDAISVVIRQSLVQMRTPYDMLGRVLAVNSMFTGSSGSLGEFRAGAVAAVLGAVPSALIGGLGTITVMLIWMWAFPQLRRVDKLTPEAGAAPGLRHWGRLRDARFAAGHGRGGISRVVDVPC